MEKVIDGLMGCTGVTIDLICKFSLDLGWFSELEVRRDVVFICLINATYLLPVSVF